MSYIINQICKLFREIVEYQGNRDCDHEQHIDWESIDRVNYLCLGQGRIKGAHQVTKVISVNNLLINRHIHIVQHCVQPIPDC